MDRIIKDPQMEQQRSIDKANDYIDEVTAAITSQADMARMISERDGENPETPEFKSTAVIGSKVAELISGFRRRFGFIGRSSITDRNAEEGRQRENKFVPKSHFHCIRHINTESLNMCSVFL